MTVLKIDANPDIERLLVAGRRAAAWAAITESRKQPVHSTSGETPESYDGIGALNVNGIDIGPAIDAAVMETVVRLGATDPARPARPWWKVWA